jgi:hypothetical protein
MTTLLTLDEKQKLADYCNEHIDFECKVVPFNENMFIGCVYLVFGSNRMSELEVPSYNDFMSFLAQSELQVL